MSFILVEVPYTRENIIAFFEHYAKVEVTFFKVSTGEIKTMTCTRNADLISSLIPYKGLTACGPERQVRVFSLDANQWRSFLIENLIEIKGADEK